MKALSVQQPWAWAIVKAGKDVENRTWRSHYRGWVAIHASAKAHPNWRMPKGTRRPKPSDIAYGAIVGVAWLSDVVDESPSRWHQPDYWGWVLKRRRALRTPIPCKGALGLWNVPPRVRAAITTQFGKLPKPRRTT